MKHIIRGSIILVSVLAVCVSAAQKKTSPFSGILDAANSALSLITAVSESFGISTERNELIKYVSSLKKTLEGALITLYDKMDENLYKTVIAGYINIIDSCEVDYNKYIINSTDVGINNLLKCTNIMDSVRPLGKYLSGEGIYGTKKLFDFYTDKNGVCNGSAMEGIFKEFSAHYVIGCIIATEIESVENNGKKGHYADECKYTMSKIVNYVGKLYRGCAQNSYAVFCSVQSILSKTTPLMPPSDLYAYLSERYPWFRFFIVKLTKDGKAKVGGNLSVGNYKIYVTNNCSYDITVFDVFTEVSREKHNFSLAIDVEANDYIDHYFENYTMTVSYFSKLPWRFVGFAPENNLSHLNRNKTVESIICNSSISFSSFISYRIFFSCILCGIYIRKNFT